MSRLVRFDGGKGEEVGSRAFQEDDEIDVKGVEEEQDGIVVPSVLLPFKNVRKIVLVMQTNVEIIKTHHQIKSFSHTLLVTINQRLTVSIQ